MREKWDAGDWAFFLFIGVCPALVIVGVIVYQIVKLLVTQ